jgi:hypothetical protein
MHLSIIEWVQIPPCGATLLSSLRWGFETTSSHFICFSFIDCSSIVDFLAHHIEQLSFQKGFIHLTLNLEYFMKSRTKFNETKDIFVISERYTL